MRKWTGTKWRLLKNSKFFLYLLGFITGASLLFCYLAVKPMYEYMSTGYQYSMEFLNRAEASEVMRPSDGMLVKADVLQSNGDVQSQDMEPSQGKPDINALIAHYFPEDFETAKKIMMCESSGNPKAKNPNSSAVGLFQIMTSLHGLTIEQAENPEINTAQARVIYLKRGWSKDWVDCYKLIN